MNNQDIHDTGRKIGYKSIKRWYLEMDAKPELQSVHFPEGVIIKPFDGDVHAYRHLNRLIGEDLGWLDRQIMEDVELEKIITNPDIKIYVLYMQEEAIGYTEIDLRNPEIAILEYFGLGPKARGKGLGRFLLQWTIVEAWKYSPEKFMLHTSDQDHPNALPNYLKAGFRIVEEKIEQQAILLVD